MSSLAAAEFRRHWQTLLAITVGVAFGVSSLCFYTFGAFIEPLRVAKGWDHAEISGALITALALPLAAPVVGRLVDAGHSRIVVITGHVLLAAGFIALTQVGRGVWQLWLGYGFIFFLAAGSSPIGYTRLLVSRFVAGRGLALGMCMSGAGLVAIVGPRAVTRVILDHGWKAGYLLLAASSVSAILIVLLAIDREAVQRSTEQFSYSGFVRDSLRKRERYQLAWLMALFFTVALAIVGPVVHFIAFLRESGTPPLQAATVAGTVGVAVVAARLLIGFLLDRFSPKSVMVTTTAITVLGLLVLAKFGAGAGAWIGAFSLGLSLGADIDFITFFAVRLFPTGAYGYAYGRTYGAYVAGSALSPTLIGLVRTVTGSYLAFFVGSAVVLLTCAVGILVLPSLGSREDMAGESQRSIDDPSDP
jgi:cyanate permease